jgi:hypothetical protein
MEVDSATKQATLWFQKGGQVTTTKVIGSARVGFDAGGVMVNAILPNAFASTSLSGLPYVTNEDREHVHQVLTAHNIRSGG